MYANEKCHHTGRHLVRQIQQPLNTVPKGFKAVRRQLHIPYTYYVHTLDVGSCYCLKVYRIPSDIDKTYEYWETDVNLRITVIMNTENYYYKKPAISNLFPTTISQITGKCSQGPLKINTS